MRVSAPQPPSAPSAGGASAACVLERLLVCSPAESAALRPRAARLAPLQARAVAARLADLRAALPPSLDVRRLALAAPSLLLPEALPAEQLAASYRLLAQTLSLSENGEDTVLLADAVLRAPSALLEAGRVSRPEV